MNVNENQLDRKNMQNMIVLNKTKTKPYDHMEMQILQVTLFFNFTRQIVIFLSACWMHLVLDVVYAEALIIV